jgi:hypothetical protein
MAAPMLLPFTKSLVRAGLLCLLLLAGGAAAIELRDAELLAGAERVMQNSAGSVRIVDARLGRIGRLVFVPEPDAQLQLGLGGALLYLLAVRRRRLPRC